jgi:cellobiose phosphorylase
VRIADTQGIDFIARLFRAFSYWKLKGFSVDLAILNDHSASYLLTLQDEILVLARKSGLHQFVEKHEGIHLLRADVMPVEDRILLLTTARVCLSADRGLEAQMVARQARSELPPGFIPHTARRA